MSAVESANRESSSVALPGLGRALILAGKLGQKSAEDIYRKASSARTSFIAELTGSGAVSAFDLAHTMSTAYAAPLVDLDAIDNERLPKGLLDPKICQAYRVIVLSKRNNRLTVATADPSDQEAVEKIKFATQLGVDWVIAEYDKLLKLVDANTATATETMEEIIGGEFEFDEVAAEGVGDNDQPAVSEVDDAPVVKFLQKMLLDAIQHARVGPALRALRAHLPGPFPHRRRTARNRLTAAGDQGQAGLAHQGDLEDGHLREAHAARRPHEAENRPNRAIDFRVSTLPTLFGEKIVIRILDPSQAKLGIDALGYDPHEKKHLLDAITAPTA
jgi:type IV pilus assembly protein PilB